MTTEAQIDELRARRDLFHENITRAVKYVASDQIAGIAVIGYACTGKVTFVREALADNEFTHIICQPYDDPELLREALARPGLLVIESPTRAAEREIEMHVLTGRRGVIIVASFPVSRQVLASRLVHVEM